MSNAPAMPAPTSVPPLGAIAVSTLGAGVGATMPLAVILSMPDIGGGLSASADDASWITTLYNVGALIGLPAAICIVFAFGRGRAMRIFGLGFAIASFAIVIGDDLSWIFAARAAQGFFGGALPLLMMLIVLTSLPPGKGQLEGLTLFAIATTSGVGVSAWVADALISSGGWRALFSSQAVAGLIYAALAVFVFRGERGNRALLKSFDWTSFFLLSLGLSGIIVFLAEGERRFWFEKWWITACLVCGVMGVALACWSMRAAARPLLTLAIFRKPTFTWVIVLQLLFRFGTLLALFIAPQYLGRLQGFRTEQLAGVMVYMTVATLLVAPLAWWATKKNPRLTLSVGLATMAGAAALCVGLTPEWAGREFIAPLIAAGIGQTLFSVATMRYAVFNANLQDGPSHGVVFNIARTVGLVGGIALTTHAVVEREKFHSSIVSEALSSLEPTTLERLAGSTRALGSWLPDVAATQRGAFANLAQASSRQAFSLSYQDAFFIAAIVLAAAAALVWVLPALPPTGAKR